MSSPNTIHGNLSNAKTKTLWRKCQALMVEHECREETRDKLVASWGVSQQLKTIAVE